MGHHSHAEELLSAQLVGRRWRVVTGWHQGDACTIVRCLQAFPGAATAATASKSRWSEVAKSATLMELPCGLHDASLGGLAAHVSHRTRSMLPFVLHLPVGATTAQPALIHVAELLKNECCMFQCTQKPLPTCQPAAGRRAAAGGGGGTTVQPPAGQPRSIRRPAPLHIDGL